MAFFYIWILERYRALLTNNDPDPPDIGNLPFSGQISLYYVLWIILVSVNFALLPIKAPTPE